MTKMNDFLDFLNTKMKPSCLKGDAGFDFSKTKTKASLKGGAEYSLKKINSLEKIKIWQDIKKVVRS